MHVCSHQGEVPPPESVGGEESGEEEETEGQGLVEWTPEEMRLLEGVTGEERRKLKKKLKRKKQRRPNAAPPVAAPAPIPATDTKFVLTGGEPSISVTVGGVAYVLAPDGGIALFDSAVDAGAYARIRGLTVAPSAPVAMECLDTPAREPVPAELLLPPMSPVDISLSAPSPPPVPLSSPPAASPPAAAPVAALGVSGDALTALAHAHRLTSMYDFPASCYTTFAHAVQTLLLNTASASALGGAPKPPAFTHQSVKMDTYVYPSSVYAARLCFAAPVAEVLSAFGRPLEGPADGSGEWCLCVQRASATEEADDASVGSGGEASAPAAPGAKLSKSAKKRAAKKRAKAVEKVAQAVAEGGGDVKDSALFMIRGQGADGTQFARELAEAVGLGPTAPAGVCVFGVRFDIRYALPVIESLECLLPGLKFVAIPGLAFSESVIDTPCFKACRRMVGMLDNVKKGNALPVGLSRPPAAVPNSPDALFDGSVCLVGLPLSPTLTTPLSFTLAAYTRDSSTFLSLCEAGVAGTAPAPASLPPALLQTVTPEANQVYFRPVGERLAAAGIPTPSAAGIDTLSVPLALRRVRLASV
ncbi:MAG: hypothetical protein P4L40_15005, partial [Terracidiphilus sp.]|nr:hypothetical protein [Terracidiphilus sp.]